MQSESSLVLVLPLLACLAHFSTLGCLLDWPTLEALQQDVGGGHEGCVQGFLDLLSR